MIKEKKNKKKLQKITLILCLFVLFIVYGSIQVLAQESNEQSKKEVELKITLTPSYILGPGDQLSITDRTLRELFGQVERFDVVIASDGYISVPLPDGTQQNILAAGYTLDELAAEVRTLFGKTLKNPLVFTQVSKYRPINIYITGEIAKPGVYKVETATTQAESGKTSTTAISTFGLTLANAIQLAGGLKPHADITSISLIRGTGSEKKIVNLKSFFNPSIPIQDLNLQSGDTVYIPKTDKFEDQAQGNVLSLGKLAYQEVPINIVGEVKAPGNFILQNDATIFDAIGMAGGPNNVGTLKKVRIARFDNNGIYKSKEYNLDELITRGVKFDEISLRPYDRIEIEASKGKEIRHFFRDTGNAYITSTLSSLGSFILQDNMFNRISRKANGLGTSALFNAGGSNISIIAPPGAPTGP